jgi:hypothetical protein
VAGKTTPDPKLILAVEDGETQGLQSIKHLDIPYVEIREWDTFNMVHAELYKDAGKGICTYKGEKYDHIIVDSYSCCGYQWYEDALKKLGWAEIGLGRGRAGLQPYSFIAEKGRQTTKKLMMLKAHIIVIAREGVYETGMGTEDYKSVPCMEMPGAKLHTELPGSFDAVIRMRRVNGQNVFVTQEEGGAVAGMRVPENFKVPKYIKPDISLVQRCIRGDRSVLDELNLEKVPERTSVQLAR